LELLIGLGAFSGLLVAPKGTSRMKLG
jgi:hypothetical protein